MPIFEIQAPDGTIYEVDAPDQNAALGAFQSFTAQPEAPQQQMESAPEQAAPPEARGVLGNIADFVTGNGDSAGARAGRKVGTALNMGGEAMSFGLVGDEAAAAADQLIPWREGDYDERLEEYRANEKQLWDENPGVALGASVAPALLPVLGQAGLVRGAASVAGRIGRGATLGAVSGATYGFAEGEGAGDRLAGAGVGAGLGATLGGAAVPAEALVRRGAGVVRGAARSLAPGVKPDRVEATLAHALAGSGQSGDDVARSVRQAVDDGQPVFALADALGETGQRALSGTARAGGSARRVVNDTLDGRQSAQGERIGSALSEALGVDKTAAARAASMKEARDSTADVAYRAARTDAAPVDVRSALSAIDERIGPMQGSGVVGDGIDKRLSSYRDRLAARDPATSNLPGNGQVAAGSAEKTAVELSDFDRVLGVKQSLQDDVGAAIRAGRNNEARELKRIISELDASLEAASPTYRAANDGYAKSSREMSRIEDGAQAARPSSRAPDNVAAFNRMTPEEQAAYRVGYGDKVLGRVENAAEGANKARPFTSGKSTEELAAMSHDPAKLSRVLDRENVMFETRRQALGGSQTADNLADVDAIGALAEKGLNPMAWLKSGASWVSNMSKGQNDATRKALAEALLSTGDKAAENIGRAVARGEKLNADQKRSLEIIMYLNRAGIDRAITE